MEAKLSDVCKIEDRAVIPIPWLCISANKSPIPFIIQGFSHGWRNQQRGENAEFQIILPVYESIWCLVHLQARPHHPLNIPIGWALHCKEAGLHFLWNTNIISSVWPEYISSTVSLTLMKCYRPLISYTLCLIRMNNLYPYHFNPHYYKAIFGPVPYL